VSDRVLVVAPHHDDEVLGVGGTMARAADEGAEVSVLVVTRGEPPAFPLEMVERVRREAEAAHAMLGVTRTIFLDLPAAALDTVAHSEINSRFDRAFEELRPDTMYLPFIGDIHSDHRIVFNSSLVAARPSKPWMPRRILAYETLSETNWNAPYVTPGFVPDTFVDITGYLERKIEAMALYASQTKPYPHERSLEAIRALATLRGSTVGRGAAEAFVQVRSLI
jgi:N-acetylglucosamine malate deacetylase 1